MAIKRIAAENLLGLALASLREDILPSLPPDKRYAAAMIANAVEIARREVASEADSPLWPLLDQLYPDDDEELGSVKRLAADIRGGTINEDKTPGLAKRLLAVLDAELAISNPRFVGKGK